MNFLKKIGLGIIKYLPMALGIAQMTTGFAPTSAQPLIDKLEAIFGAGMGIEKDFTIAFSGQKTGPQKLLALTAQTQDILKQLSMVTTHGIADPTLFSKGSQEIAQGVVDCMQALKGKDGTTVVGAATIEGVGKIS